MLPRYLGIIIIEVPVMNLEDRKRGCFFGGIVGDAYGSQWEFKRRHTYHISPDMGPNVFGLPPGSFTDDSSMLLCLAMSLIQYPFDPIDQMIRYLAWWHKGYMSSAPDRGCFDIGRTTSTALAEFHLKYIEWKASNDGTEFCPYAGTSPGKSWDSGNGGIMRLAPVPIVYAWDVDVARVHARSSSRVTHGSPECLDAAALMSDVIVFFLGGGGKHSLPRFLTGRSYDTQNVRDIASFAFSDKVSDRIMTSGYVIHTLEAAMWALYSTETFEEGMMTLAAMGGDVDTVCCVYGQIAGALYGKSAIPDRWLNVLQMKPALDEICDKLCSTDRNPASCV